MNAIQPPLSMLPPGPLERGPRADGYRAPHSWLRLAPPALRGALVALVGRDTRSLDLTSAQRLSHFPASPLVAISWYRGVDAGLIGDSATGPYWRPFASPVIISGSQSHPTVSWGTSTGRGYMACFNADAAQALFGLDLTAIQDRFVPAAELLGEQWAPLWGALLASEDDALMSVLVNHLAAPWQGLQSMTGAQPSLRQMGRHWVERLAWKAQQWSGVHGTRHVERRIKSFSGRSLREWQSLVRTEDLFFAARDCYEAGQPLDWAGLAQSEGFADQSHMNRATKRITGFSPGAFALRFIEDESFWMYRLWV